MTEKQKLEAVNFIAGWLDKASVGCLIVGLFQPDHMIGGIIGSAVCFTVAITLKVLERKMSFNAAIACIVVFALALGVVGFFLTHKSA